MITIDLNDYSNSIKKDISLVSVSDITELRDNTTLVAKELIKHHGSRGTDNHPVVTTTVNGFAPGDIYEVLKDYKEELDELQPLIDEDRYPPGSVAIWCGDPEIKIGGKMYSLLPDGWVLCDGREHQGMLTKDLRYSIPIGSDADNPVGVVSLKPGLERKTTVFGDPDIEGNIFWYIKKLDTTGYSAGTHKVTITQPANGGGVIYSSASSKNNSYSVQLPHNTLLSIYAAADKYYKIDSLTVHVPNPTSTNPEARSDINLTGTYFGYLEGDVSAEGSFKFLYPEPYTFEKEFKYTCGKAAWGDPGTHASRKWVDRTKESPAKDSELEVIVEKDGLYNVSVTTRVSLSGFSLPSGGNVYEALGILYNESNPTSKDAIKSGSLYGPNGKNSCLQIENRSKLAEGWNKSFSFSIKNMPLKKGLNYMMLAGYLLRWCDEWDISTGTMTLTGVRVTPVSA